MNLYISTREEKTILVNSITRTLTERMNELQKGDRNGPSLLELANEITLVNQLKKKIEAMRESSDYDR